jgi:hypothetical protein
MKAGSALYGITRDKIIAMREVLPTWSEDNTIIGVYENGKYKYIDFSHGFFYDTMTQPVNTIIANVEKAKVANEEDPLIVGFVNGITKAMGKTLEPFFSESIWTGAVFDVLVRNGIKHVAYTLSPGSLPQLNRLIAAMQNKSVKGVNYEIPDELLGFVGFRKVPLDLERNLEFKIRDYLVAKENERKKILEGLRTGDPITDENQVIRQFFEANKSFYEDMSKLRRVYDAVKTLGMRDPKIVDIFGSRRQGPLYDDIENNKFVPIFVTKGMIISTEDLAKEKNIPNVLNSRVMKQIEKMEKDMQRLKLNQDFDLDINNYLLETKQTSELQTPPLPQEVTQTAVSPEVVNSGQVAQLNNGLTMAENALLSEEEKMIKLRQRNMIT